MQRKSLCDVLGHPQGTDLLLHLGSPAPRQHDDGLTTIETADLSQDGEPIHLRHFQIKHNDIGTFSAKELQALPTTLSEDHVIAFPPEEPVKEITDALLIINHQNLGHGTSQHSMVRLTISCGTAVWRRGQVNALIRSAPRPATAGC